MGPLAKRSLQVSSVACVHMQDAGHMGICATMHRLRTYCIWEGMKEDVAEFVQQCLHCMDSRVGNVVPRPLDEILHGTEVGEVVHFDHLKLGDSDNGYAYVLVLVDNVSSEPLVMMSSEPLQYTSPPKTVVSDCAHVNENVCCLLTY